MGMSSVLQFPASVPWWLVLVAIIPLGLYALMLLAMPFSVFGVKNRLEAIEARLDDLHADIRSIAILLASNGARVALSDDDALDHTPPPIAPIRSAGLGDARTSTQPDAVSSRRMSASVGGRAEPRLNWPK
jgi:hypothetical protein